MKYRNVGETFEDCCYRLSSNLSDSDEHRRSLSDIFCNMRFLPAGRVQAAIGSPKRVTPWNCLAGDTLVLTKEFGLKKIKELDEATIYDGDRNWIKVKFNSFGIQPLWKVSFTNGKEHKEIYCTEDHGWISNGVKILTKNLKYNDKVDHNSTQTRGHGYSKYSRNYRLGVIHGLVYGDGNATNDNGFQLRVCQDQEDLKYYLEDFPCSYPPSYNGQPCYYFFGKNAWTNFKQFPEEKDRNDLPYLSGFIAGWMAADGCVGIRGEATICGDKAELDWLSTYGPLVGIYVTGTTLLNPITNFGLRKKQSMNMRLSTLNLVPDNFIIERKRQRFKQKHNKQWRIKSSYLTNLQEEVFCPSVPTTQSFTLDGGLHSSNCFVSGVIADDFNDIMEKAKEAGHTMRLGGGIGYDFSTLRPRGSLIKSLGSYSSGPISFMDIFDSVCGTIASAGHRRGAQMGVLRVDHPDIEEFVHAKRNSDKLTRFNISVGVTDSFMKAVKEGKEFNLKFHNKVYKTVDARMLWDTIMRSTWDWAEPGVIFIDRVNEFNNLWYCESIATTNPCGEQPLPPYGACLLGSFNLVKYAGEDTNGRYFNHKLFKDDIKTIVRAMDNIIDLGIYPLPQQEQEGKAKRRMGLGITGLANCLEYIVEGAPYGSERFIEWMNAILKDLRDVAYETSVELAKEKGTFPLYDERYLEGKFIKTLPEHILESMKKYGIRNSHLTSIAPTGTISLSADNISSGIEPVYTHAYTRTIQTFEGPRFEDVEDFGWRTWKVKGKTASELSPEEHVSVLINAQQFVDSACSKTCNVGDDVTWDRFKNIYMMAFDGGCKGVTTFRSAGKRLGILNEVKSEHPEKPQEVEYIDDEDSVCYFDEKGQKHCE